MEPDRCCEENCLKTVGLSSASQMGGQHSEGWAQRGEGERTFHVQEESDGELCGGDEFLGFSQGKRALIGVACPQLTPPAL